MPITSKKITEFANKVADLGDKPNQSGLTAAQVKAHFDAAPNELREAHNALIDMLLASTTGDSGAQNIGSEEIAGLTGLTIHDQLSDLLTKVLTRGNTEQYTPTTGYHPATKNYVDDTTAGVVLGQIPDGSLTPAKLSQAAKAAQNISITDTESRFASGDVEGALSELFTFANDGKTQVANAVTAKGVTASPADTFSTLATKIGQISTGKKYANGMATSGATTLVFKADNNTNVSKYPITVSGLGFLPSMLIALLENTANNNWDIVIFTTKESLTPSTVSVNAKGHSAYNSGTTTSYQFFNLDGTVGYFIDGGFRIPAFFANAPYNWYAFE